MTVQNYWRAKIWALIFILKSVESQRLWSKMARNIVTMKSEKKFVIGANFMAFLKL